MSESLTLKKLPANKSSFVSNQVVIEALQEKAKCLKPITLTWQNIVVYPPEKRKGGSILNKFKRRSATNDLDDRPSKLIIDNVDGIAKSNEVLAIMGASGAGKTSLLNVLNFRNRGVLKVEGEVRVNGHLVRSVEEIASISGYVQQDDLFIGSLTVRENLTFQAMLRMDKKYSTEERLHRVEEVLQDLNLKKCENTPIQIQDQKGISGGEKRRLGFASEVLTNPLILFCDEPTSGLDSFMALSVVECMKRLASQGRTIVCTIHQPSSEIFEMFDKLSLLAEGRLAFIGSLSSAYQFFDSQGHTVPYNYNPGDFYIKTLAVIPADRENSIRRIEQICDGFNNSPNKNSLLDDIEQVNSKTYSQDEMVDFKQEIKYKSSFATQMRWLLWRNFISLSRNPMAFRVQLVQAVVISFLFGLIYFRLELNQKGVQNVAGVLFLCVTNNSFGSMFIVINTFPAEIPIFIREYENRMYRVISYYLARISLDIPTYILMPFLFVSIVYWMANLNNDIYRFFVCVAMVVLVAQSALAFGTFLSAIAPTVNIALSLSGPLLVPLMIFSGYLLNTEDIPKYFLPLRFLSWFGYTNENLMINQFQGITNIECDDPSEPNCIKRFSNGDDVLEFFKVDPEYFYLNIGCTLAIIVGWRILAFIVLLIRSTNAKSYSLCWLSSPNL